MLFALYSRQIEPHNKANVCHFAQALVQRGGTLWIHQNLEKIIPSEWVSGIFQNQLPENINLLISMGGDGTVLETATLVRDSGIPVLGINLGKLGFLAAQNDTSSDLIVESLFQQDYTIESRSLIQLETSNALFGDDAFALNDLTILKKDRASMIGVHVSVNGQLLSTIWADGIIIATPTGSTGYSLSCGGPIIFPDSPILAITPIAPHQLNVRPVLVPDNAEIELSFQQKGVRFAATLDSRTSWFDSDISLKISKAPFNFALVRMSWENFPETIRKKLQWGVDIRN